MRQERRQVVEEPVLVLDQADRVGLVQLSGLDVAVALVEDEAVLLEDPEAEEEPGLVGRLLLQELEQAAYRGEPLLGPLGVLVELVDDHVEVEQEHAVRRRVRHPTALHGVFRPRRPDLLGTNGVHELGDDRLLVVGHHPAVLHHGVPEVLLVPDHEAHLLPRQALLGRLWFHHLVNSHNTGHERQVSVDTLPHLPLV